MTTTSIGIFNSFSHVIHAANTLQRCGFGREEISVITPQVEAANASEGAVGRDYSIVDKRRMMLPIDLSTFVADAWSLFVSGIGQVAAAGPLAFVLSRTINEDQGSSLLDTLDAFGVSPQQAEHYAEGIRRGGTLLAVSAADYLAERAEDVLILHAAVDIERRARRWQQQGWLGFNSSLPPYSAHDLELERRWQVGDYQPGRDWSPHERDFRSHFYLFYSDAEFLYEHYAPAYHYGYQLAGDDRYEDKSWDDLESRVQQDWQRRSATSWITVVDAIRYGFFKGHEHDRYRAETINSQTS